MTVTSTLNLKELKKTEYMKISETIPNSWAEPWKIKTVEHIRLLPVEERRIALAEAGWNTFLLRSRDVYIDLLTDSGTSAMSDKQWAAMMTGDEAYAGSDDYYELEQTVREIYGYKYFIPTHQGRAAEHLLSQILTSKGQIVPGNMYFTTTRFHQEYAGGEFADIIVDEAHDPNSTHPFKGNVDLAKLSEIVERSGADRIAYISLETNVNMAGGQPFSMENLRQLRAYCDRHQLLIMLDATRAVENAYFIKKLEVGYADRAIADILREICAHTDGCTMSAKKDSLVNIGGFLCLNDPDLAEQARALVVCFEGLHTYGGMAGRDMGAMAIGIRESVDFAHIRARVEQVGYLGSRLEHFGVPVVRPFGGHAIYLDAKQILPHLDQDEFPAQRLAGEIFLESGVRTMERGNVSAGRDKEGHNYRPELELVRLTVPRRVYTQSHLDVVSEGVARVCQRAGSIAGLRLVFEPKQLRFFQARFEPLKL
jgi:tyrosine phenol-lyase